jgi:uncharacterized membrane protein YoaK (UPF0700 family)
VAADAKKLERDELSHGSPPDLLRVAAVVLSFAAGATDAFAFLLLGGVFTANMTGNLVLAGLTERNGYTSMIIGIAVALVFFVGGLFASFGIARPRPPTARLVVVLALGTAAQAAVFAGWLLSPSPSTMWGQAPLIALSAFAMAAQTAVSKRAEVRSGVSTTYVTGTITSLVADWSDRKSQDSITRFGVLIALVLGALSGSLLIGVTPALGAALPVVPALVGIALVASAAKRKEEPQ